MTRIPAIGTGGASSRDLITGLRGVSVDDFLQLMITELRNQDPLNPWDNAQMLQQISQIREIAATEELSNLVGRDLVQTLSGFSLGQKLSAASALMGRRVHGITKENTHVLGIVERVSVENGSPVLHVAVEKEVDTAGSEISARPGTRGIRQVALDRVVDLVSEDADWRDVLPRKSN